MLLTYPAESAATQTQLGAAQLGVTTAVGGTVVKGTVVKGTVVKGTAVGGTVLNGTVVDQNTDPAYGVRIDGIPCQSLDPDLWFAETPAELESAKSHCAACPVRIGCLAGALDRREPWGVWGGEIFDQGAVVARKRPRGRPRKLDAEAAA